MDNSQDNNQSFGPNQNQTQDSLQDPAGPPPQLDATPPPTVISPEPMKSGSKSKVLVFVAVFILVLGLGFAGYFLTKKDTPQANNGAPTNSNQNTGTKSLSEIIASISTEMPKINEDLEKEEINTESNSFKVIEYRNKEDYVSGVLAEPANSIYFENTKLDGVARANQGQAENKLIVDTIKANGFIESKENLGVDYDSSDIPLNVIFTNSEFVCQVSQLDKGLLDIGLGCIAKSKLTEQLAMIDEYYTAISEGKPETGSKNIIYTSPTRKDSQTAGYKIGKIGGQVQQGSGGAYYLYYGKDKTWKVAASIQWELACNDFAGNADAILAYKGEECFSADGTTKSKF